MTTNEKDPQNEEELPAETLESVSGGVIGDCIRLPKWPVGDYPIKIDPIPFEPIILTTTTE